MPPLSPLPQLRANPCSPRRKVYFSAWIDSPGKQFQIEQVSESHSVFTRPLKPNNGLLQVLSNKITIIFCRCRRKIFSSRVYTSRQLSLSPTASAGVLQRYPELGMPKNFKLLLMMMLSTPYKPPYRRTWLRSTRWFGTRGCAGRRWRRPGPGCPRGCW